MSSGPAKAPISASKKSARRAARRRSCSTIPGDCSPSGRMISRAQTATPSSMLRAVAWRARNGQWAAPSGGPKRRGGASASM